MGHSGLRNRIGFFAGFSLVKKDTPAQQKNVALAVPKSGMLSEVNTSAAPVTKILEDSTVIVLEPNTTLNYPVHFLPGKREVYLEGKAFFNVSKDARRPFLFTTTTWFHTY